MTIFAPIAPIAQIAPIALISLINLSLIDINTLTVVTPPMAPGPQQIILTSPAGDTYSLDAAFTAN